MKKTLIFLVFALPFSLSLGNITKAANLSFDADTKIRLTGLDTTLYTLSGSEADSLEISGSTLTVDIPADSTFTLGAGNPMYNVLRVAPTGGAVILTFDSSDFSGGYAREWTLDSSTTTQWDILVGTLLANRNHRMFVNGNLHNSFTSGDSSQVSFTYTGPFEDKTFLIESFLQESSGGGSNTPSPPCGLLVNPSTSLQASQSAEKTPSPDVTLKFVTGSNVTQYRVSNTNSFQDSPLRIIPLSNTLSWNLCSHLPTEDDCLPGEYKVWVKYYTAHNISADPVSATIVYDPSFVPQEKPSTEIMQLQERVRVLQLTVIGLARQLIGLLQEHLRAASNL